MAGLRGKQRNVLPSLSETQPKYLISKTTRKQRNCTESDVNFIVHQFFKSLTGKLETNIDS